MPARSDQQADSKLNYMLVRSRRRTLSLIVREDGSLEVRCPLRYPKSEIDRFIKTKADWIRRKQSATRSMIPVAEVPPEQKRWAEKAIQQRFAEISRIQPAGQAALLRIRDQRSRWGSCNSRGTISLNRRCALLPVELQDYVYLHELCHLQHMNHSPAFWHLLEQLMPDARQRRRELNRYRLTSVT